MTKLYDFTQLDALARCEAEHGYRYQQHLARAVPDASAHFGTAVHAGVRALFAGAPATTHEDEVSACQAASAAWANGSEIVAASKKPYLTLEYAQEIVKMYAEQYGLFQGGNNGTEDASRLPTRGIEVHASRMAGVNRTGQENAQTVGRSGNEDTGHSRQVTVRHGLGSPSADLTSDRGARAFVAPPKSSPLAMVLNEQYLELPERSLCGIVDRVVRSKVDGQLYVMDLKSTGLYLSQAWFEQWRHSLQAAIYMDLVEAQYVAQPVAGFWVDAIHVNRRGHPKPEDFMRVGPFAYSHELRSELRDVVDVLVGRAKELEEWPGGALKNPRSCWRYNALCSYFQFCTLNAADRADAVKMALLAGDFKEEQWQPSLR